MNEQAGIFTCRKFHLIKQCSLTQSPNISLFYACHGISIQNPGLSSLYKSFICSLHKVHNW